MRNFVRENGHFSLKTSFRNVGLRNFLRPPKLGTRSPPMVVMQVYRQVSTQVGRQTGRQVLQLPKPQKGRKLSRYLQYTRLKYMSSRENYHVVYPLCSKTRLDLIIGYMFPVSISQRYNKSFQSYSPNTICRMSCFENFTSILHRTYNKLAYAETHGEAVSLSYMYILRNLIID